jgi:Protein of unknown function (DUF4235)
MATTKSNPSTGAKILYRPVGIVSSIAAGLVAGAIFKAVWHRTISDGEGDPPKALESEYSLKEILVAALIQGAIFAVVKAATDRGGARAFERVTGQWPGN